MEAIQLTDGTAVLDLKRCIGCGLCVSTCPSGSLSLVRKPKTKQPYVPETIVETNVKLGKARGKLSIGKRVGMQVRSKLDRFLAPRSKSSGGSH